MRRILVLLLLLCPLAARAQDIPTVAAAADLRFAMDELVEAYRRETGGRLRVSYGSSGVFFQQILQGAPFQLFLSADETYVFRLHKAGKVADRGTLYAIGRIVLVAPVGGTLAVDGGLRGLRQALDQGRIRRFAIANPEHAPYGERAREALLHAGLWQRLAPSLVYGENVAQALQFVTVGAAQGGIVALSLVKTPGFAATGRAALIPESWHRPLRQRMVLTPAAGAEARRFHAWLQTPPARRIFIRYGFTLPGEAG